MYTKVGSYQQQYMLRNGTCWQLGNTWKKVVRVISSLPEFDGCYEEMSSKHNDKAAFKKRSTGSSDAATKECSHADAHIYWSGNAWHLGKDIGEQHMFKNSEVGSWLFPPVEGWRCDQVNQHNRTSGHTCKLHIMDTVVPSASVFQHDGCTFKESSSPPLGDWTAVDQEGTCIVSSASEEMLQAALRVRSYCANVPPVFKYVSQVMNDPGKRQMKTPKVVAAMTWIKMLDIDVDKLPLSLEIGPQTCYRGMTYRYTDKIWQEFQTGLEIVWYTFKSVTTDMDLMSDSLFCGLTGPRTIIEISDCVGKSIAPLSMFDEAEVLLRPGARFKVLEAKRQSGEDGDPFLTADILRLQMIADGVVRSLDHVKKVYA